MLRRRVGLWFGQYRGEGENGRNSLGGRTVLAGLEGGALDVAVCFEGFSESEGREDREVHEGVE